VGFVLLRTRYGNWVFATGGNPRAANAQGVPINRVKVINFMLTGLLAGAAGVIQFGHRTSVDPLRGDGLELIAVAACVIGGVRLSGGFGTIVGPCIGVLLLQMLEQGLVEGASSNLSSRRRILPDPGRCNEHLAKWVG